MVVSDEISNTNYKSIKNYTVTNIITVVSWRYINNQNNFAYQKNLK